MQNVGKNISRSEKGSLELKKIKQQENLHLTQVCEKTKRRL